MAAPKDEPLTYGGAGVSIERGASFVERIKPLARLTERPGVMGALGGFGGLFDLAACGFRDPVLVAANDGVGTKLRLAIEAGRHDTVGIDLVAMCVNDLVVQGAEPLFFLDYLAAGALEGARDEAVVSGIAKGCREAGCALLGGETAEMPGMYGGGDYDLAGFAVGAVERDRLLPQGVAAGDLVLGLRSSGLHSNGFSLVRRVVERAGLALDASAPFEAPGPGEVPTLGEAPTLREAPTLGEALLAPTRIYVRSILDALRGDAPVRALAHITGGGLPENLPRVLPAHLAARIDLAAIPLPPVMRWVRETGPVEDGEMLRTFNCGIGMVVVCPSEGADALSAALGETLVPLGEIVPREGDALVMDGRLG